jgi:hypothetical protein
VERQTREKQYRLVEKEREHQKNQDMGQQVLTSWLDTEKDLQM